MFYLVAAFIFLASCYKKGNWHRIFTAQNCGCSCCRRPLTAIKTLTPNKGK